MNPMDRTELKMLFSPEDIHLAVMRISEEIEKDYRGRPIVMISVLKGSFIFTADLARAIALPITLDFIQVASYGREKTPGRIRLIKDVETPIHKREVILVDDIIDTGLTTRFLLNHLRQRRPASIRLCALLNKPSRRSVDVHIDYLGFNIPAVFVVGYGIDYAERYRNLPGIYSLPSGNS